MPDRLTNQPFPITYITKRFPRLSETFILDEIIGLEQNGVELSLVAIANPKEQVVQQRSEKVKSEVTYIEPPDKTRLDPRWIIDLTLAVLSSVRKNPKALAAMIRELPSKEDPIASFKHIVYGSWVARHVQRVGSKHIHAAFAHSPAAIASVAAKIARVSFSFAGHAKDIYISNPHQLAKRIEEARFVLVCSNSAKDEVLKISKTNRPSSKSYRDNIDEKVLLRYHGVDLDRFTPMDPRSSQHRVEGPVILVVGRLVPKKGYAVLIEALALLSQAKVPFRCRIVGAGPLREELVKEITRFKILDNVVLLGALEQEAIVGEYQKAEIFVQASIVLKDGDRDGIPNALLEAMASSLAVVGSDVAGIPELIQSEETGLLVSSNDPHALAQALWRLIDDPSLAARLGHNARNHLKSKLSKDLCSQMVAKTFLQWVSEIDRSLSDKLEHGTL